MMSNTDSSSLNPKKRGLGRGLDALFEHSDDDDAHDDTVSDVMPHDANNASGGRKTIGVEQLSPNPAQPRKDFTQEALDDLANSLKEYGVLQPLLVRPHPTEDGRYEIIAGERRWRAAQLAQLHEVPVTIQDMGDSEALQIGLVENLQREDLNAIEEALGYRNLMEQFGHTQQHVAKLVGKSRAQITNMMRLLSLPESIQGMVRAGDLTTGHVRTLIGRDNAEELAERAIREQLSVRDLEKLSSAGATAPKSATGGSSAQTDTTKDADTRALEKELADALGLEVSINVKAGGQKGDVKIAFHSMEQLDFVLQRLSRDTRLLN